MGLPTKNHDVLCVLFDPHDIHCKPFPCIDVPRAILISEGMCKVESWVGHADTSSHLL